MKDKLNLLLIRHERISIKDFGTTDSKTEEIEIVKFKVNDINKNIFVEALVIPTIFSTLINQVSNSVLLSKYLHLTNLPLAQNSVESLFNIDNVNRTSRKSNDPIVLESTLGWIISGPYSMDSERNVYNVESHFLFVPPSLSKSNVVEKESFESYSKIWDIE